MLPPLMLAVPFAGCVVICADDGVTLVSLAVTLTSVDVSSSSVAASLAAEEVGAGAAGALLPPPPPPQADSRVRSSAADTNWYNEEVSSFQGLGNV